MNIRIVFGAPHLRLRTRGVALTLVDDAGNNANDAANEASETNAETDAKIILRQIQLSRVGAGHIDRIERLGRRSRERGLLSSRRRGQRDARRGHGIGGRVGLRGLAGDRRFRGGFARGPFSRGGCGWFGRLRVHNEH